MTHARQQIRAAIVSKLETAAIVASGGVYSNRLLQFHADDLPVINVTASEETSKVIEVSPSSKHQRELKVEVSVLAKAADSTTLDDTLDSLAEQVEAALGADPWLADTANASELAATGIEFDATGEVAIGQVRLTYTVNYTF